MRTPEQERYEAIYRVVVRRARNSLFVCWGTTIVMAFGAGLVIAYFGPDLPAAWPVWLRFVVLLVPAFVLIGMVPGVIQWLFLGEAHARALEVVNGFFLGEVEQYTRVTGSRRPPRPRNRAAALRWRDTNEGRGTRGRVRLLLWAGDFAAAAEAINELPGDGPADDYHRELLIQLLNFTRGGAMDLSRARHAVQAISAGPERDIARMALAFEEARQVHADGGPWLDPLLTARSEVERLPRGASMRDRVIANVPLSLVTFAVVGFLVWSSMPGK